MNKEYQRQQRASKRRKMKRLVERLTKTVCCQEIRDIKAELHIMRTTT
jgi:hypothetical protein